MTSVAVVVLDTLRKDYFTEYFSWLPGRRYERAYSTANWTAPAHASLLTGRYPTETGVHAKAPSLDYPDPILPERLSKAGYRTRCWTANPNLSRTGDWHRGFDEFVGPTNLLTGTADTVDWDRFAAEHDDGGIGRYISAMARCFRREYDTVASIRSGLAYARHGIEGIDTVDDGGAQTTLDRARSTDVTDREFLLVNLMETHTPYHPPTPYRRVPDPVRVTVRHSLGLDNPPGPTVDAYESAVDYLAAVYRDLFAVLNSDFDYIVTLADHGEMLGESGLWNHAYGLLPPVTSIPLVISGPDMDGVEDTPVNLLDVHRWLQTVTGIGGESRGRNLTDTLSPSPLLTEYHGLIPVARRRLEADVPTERLAAIDATRRGAVLPNGVYACEHEDRVRTWGTADRKPSDVIANLTDDLTVRETTEATPDIDAATADRLADLGYI